ncbi:MAG: transglutaminase-like domain-containing protein [Burkholderiales bacterium]|nr:transglutaminase-like domain-containing protein [Burkholderiales bacterium]
MNRRDFIKLAASGGTLFAFPAWGYYDEIASWKTYRLNYHVSLPEEAGSAKLWLPLPDSNDTVYQRNLGSVWSEGPARASLFDPPKNPAAAFFGEWIKSGPRNITVGTMIKTADRTADLRKPGSEKIPPALKHYLAPGSNVVRKTAMSVTRTAKTPLGKARAIYDWVVENAYYDPAIEGCGKGDAGEMLESGKMGGKSMDMASLFVSLCGSAGIPARGTYGILLTESGSGKIATSYHVRAEFYLAGPGWVPVDPAEIHRVMQEENRRIDDPKIAELKDKLFGYWKMNWIGLNHERDVPLPFLGSKIPLFIYPYAQVGGEFLDPARIAYQIEVNEMVGTGIHFS